MCDRVGRNLHRALGPQREVTLHSDQLRAIFGAPDPLREPEVGLPVVGAIAEIEHTVEAWLRLKDRHWFGRVGKDDRDPLSEEEAFEAEGPGTVGALRCRERLEGALPFDLSVTLGAGDELAVA